MYRPNVRVLVAVIAMTVLAAGACAAPAAAPGPPTRPAQVVKPSVATGYCAGCSVETRSLGVQWAAPEDGGAPIESYRVLIHRENPTSSEDVELVVSAADHAVTGGAGLNITAYKSGQTFTVRVAATNAVGEGPLSETSDPVTN